MRWGWMLCLGLISVLRLQAQDMFVDPVFTEHVEVVAVYPRIDAENRTLHVFTDGGWKAISFPVNFNEVSSVDDLRLDGEWRWMEHRRINYSIETFPMSIQPDGTIFLAGTSSDSGTNLWTIHPETGVFQRFVSPCATDSWKERLLHPEKIETVWITVQDAEVVYFCQLLTGEHFKTFLPPDENWSNPILSPNRDYFYFERYTSDDWYFRQTFLYSYRREDGRLLYLGEEVTEQGDNSYSMGWVTPTIYGFQVRDMPEWSVSYFYMVDVSKPMSFKNVMNTWRFDAALIKKPPSLVDQPAELWDGPTHGPCKVQVFDFTAYEATTYETGTLCDYGRTIPDGTGDQLYHALYPGAGLVRYNYRTGIRKQIFVGEIEGLGSVSPKGFYAQIEIGDSGKVDTIQDDPDPFIHDNEEADELTVIRLSDGIVVGAVPPSAEWVSDQHLWDDTFLYTITPDGVTKTPVPFLAVERVFSLPAIGDMIVRSQGGSYRLLNLFTQEVTPLFQYDSPHRVHFQLMDSGLLRLTFLETLAVSMSRYGHSDEERVLWEMDIRLR